MLTLVGQGSGQKLPRFKDRKRFHWDLAFDGTTAKSAFDPFR